MDKFKIPMEEKYKIVFQSLLDIRLNENILCQEFWKKLVVLKNNFNEEDCWFLITDNGEWIFNSGAMGTDLVQSWFSEKELNEHNIFTSGKVVITDGRAIGMGSAIIEAQGHSKILLFENAHCDAHDTTFVKGFGNSSFNTKECMGEAFDNCKVIAGYQSKVEAWDNAIVEAQDYSMVIKHDKSIVTASKRAHVVNQ